MTKEDTKMTPLKLTAAICALLSLSACGSLDRLANVGQPPQMTAIENPVTQPEYKPVSLPMPAPTNTKRASNSLWGSDRVTFFKDQRAKQVGDIITVMIDITDEASMENESARSRSSNENANLGRLLGLEQSLDKILPEAVNGAGGALNPQLADFGSTSGSSGNGSTEREEEVSLEVAALVTQILPNGNMVITGRQEVRVNFEKRILQIQGVIRPSDISTENTIQHNRIAEARIVYGGEGQLTDVQQPRYGQQIYDIVFPF